MATINEVQSDNHKYLPFDAVALPAGDSLHSTVTDDGGTVETTILRTEEGLHITQSFDGEVVEVDWSLKDVATWAASAHLGGADAEKITVSDEFIEEHMDPEQYAEYQYYLVNGRPEPEPTPQIDIEALLAMLADGAYTEEGAA
jgi:hypothetical protein